MSPKHPGPSAAFDLTGRTAVDAVMGRASPSMQLLLDRVAGPSFSPMQEAVDALIGQPSPSMQLLLDRVAGPSFSPMQQAIDAAIGSPRLTATHGILGRSHTLRQTIANAGLPPTVGAFEAFYRAGDDSAGTVRDQIDAVVSAFDGLDLPKGPPVTVNVPIDELDVLAGDAEQAARNPVGAGDWWFTRLPVSERWMFVIVLLQAVAEASRQAGADSRSLAQMALLAYVATLLIFVIKSDEQDR